MKALILDDETYCSETLELLIRRHCSPPLDTITFSDPYMALDYLQDNVVDLLFLDVEMPLMSGFDFLEKARSFNGSVIFTTAYDAYALKAFQVDAIAYLLKPVDKTELIKAVDKVRRNSVADSRLLLEMLREKLSMPVQTEKKAAIPTSEGIHMIAHDRLIRCESDGSYSTLYIEGAKPLLVSKNLRELEDLLNSPNFFRIHKSHLINLSHIRFVSKQDGGDVLMSDNSSVPISRSAKQEFFRRISQNGPQ